MMRSSVVSGWEVFRNGRYGSEHYQKMRNESIRSE